MGPATPPAPGRPPGPQDGDRAPGHPPPRLEPAGGTSAVGRPRAGRPPVDHPRTGPCRGGRRRRVDAGRSHPAHRRLHPFGGRGGRRRPSGRRAGGTVRGGGRGPGPPDRPVRPPPVPPGRGRPSRGPPRSGRIRRAGGPAGRPSRRSGWTRPGSPSIGHLSALPTVSSNTLMTPVVATLAGRPSTEAAPDEVARIFDVALAELLEDKVFHEEWWAVPGRPGRGRQPRGGVPGLVLRRRGGDHLGGHGPGPDRTALHGPRPGDSGGFVGEMTGPGTGSHVGTGTRCPGGIVEASRRAHVSGCRRSEVWATGTRVERTGTWLR